MVLSRVRSGCDYLKIWLCVLKICLPDPLNSSFAALVKTMNQMLVIMCGKRLVMMYSYEARTRWIKIKGLFGLFVLSKGSIFPKLSCHSYGRLFFLFSLLAFQLSILPFVRHITIKLQNVKMWKNLLYWPLNGYKMSIQNKRINSNFLRGSFSRCSINYVFKDNLQFVLHISMSNVKTAYLFVVPIILL